MFAQTPLLFDSCFLFEILKMLGSSPQHKFQVRIQISKNRTLWTVILCSTFHNRKIHYSRIHLKGLGSLDYNVGSRALFSAQIKWVPPETHSGNGKVGGGGGGKVQM